ncbi:transposase [Micromonospora sp. NPDC005313]|uniref:transposase n=1 Tax=unclassified Micromonospora TaxID=2617518 RepID=UPI0033A0490A
MGKKTTGHKRHLIVDTMGLILVVMVTSASVNDRPGGRRILARLAEAFTTIALVWAGGGYANSIDSSLLAWAKEQLGILVEIVKRTDDVAGFNYERLTVNSETTIKVAMTRLMAIRLARQATRWNNATEREATRRINAERLLTV